jgi:hypothetical protein
MKQVLRKQALFLGTYISMILMQQIFVIFVTETP